MAKFESLMLRFTVFCLAGMMADEHKKKYVVSQKCLGCICEAESSCDTSEGCSRGICGAFGIMRPYWLDGGKPTVNNESPAAFTAFSNCARDISCSVQAVQEYMNKFQYDCNADGKIDCDDFVRIHKLGKDGCRSDTLTGIYAQRYQVCKTFVGV